MKVGRKRFLLRNSTQFTEKYKEVSSLLFCVLCNNFVCLYVQLLEFDRESKELTELRELPLEFQPR